MNQKGFAPIIVLIVILVLVAIGGAYYLGTQTKHITALSPVVTPSQSPANSNFSPSPNSTGDESSEQITWKRTNLGSYSFEYPYGWNVAITWPNEQDNAMDIGIDPNPINTGPRDGPLAAIDIFVWNGSQTPNDKLTSVIKQAKDSLEPGYTEETIQTTIGSVNHFEGKLNGVMLGGTPQEYYIFLLDAADNINKQVVEVSTLNKAASPDIVRHVATSFQKI